MNTALFSDINWLAVLVAAVAYFMLGAIWYSALFQKPWVRYHNINMNDPELRKGTGAIMTTSFFMMAFTTVCLAVLIERLGLSGVMSGIKIGLLTGVGFAFMAISISYLYLKKPSGLHFIDGGYHVAGQVIAAIILCVWQ